MSAAVATEAALNFNAAAAIIGALGICFFALAGLLVIWRLCNGREAAAGQRAEMPSDHVFQTNPDDIIHTECGTFRIIDGEYVPFEKAA